MLETLLKIQLPKCENGEYMETISREDMKWFEQLSYFFGVWLGDGHYMWQPWIHKYELGLVNMDQEILLKAQVELEASISKMNKTHMYQETTKNERPLYRLRWNDKQLTDFVCRTTAYKMQIPSYIWQASKKSKLDFFSGLMDTDGSISMLRNGYWFLRFSGGKGFVNQFPDLCRVIGIDITSKTLEKHSNPNHADRWLFNISIKSAVDNGFTFYCNRKRARLLEYINHKPSETTRQTSLETKI